MTSPFVFQPQARISVQPTWAVWRRGVAAPGNSCLKLQEKTAGPHIGRPRFSGRTGARERSQGRGVGWEPHRRQQLIADGLRREPSAVRSSFADGGGRLLLLGSEAAVALSL
jgi:hypothetical protein